MFVQSMENIIKLKSLRSKQHWSFFVDVLSVIIWPLSRSHLGLNTCISWCNELSNDTKELSQRHRGCSEACLVLHIEDQAQEQPRNPVFLHRE